MAVRQGGAGPVTIPRRGRTGRRVVTVMVADLSGSTALGERLDAEELRGVLGGFFRGLSHEIQRFGGTIDKYIGDAVRATFEGHTREAGAIHALDAGLAMLDAIATENEALERRLGLRLSLRIGVNTGDVLTAEPGRAGQPTVGRTVSVAQRLESTAAPNTVRAGESTYRLTRRSFKFEAAPRISFGVDAEAIRAYRVVARRRPTVDVVEIVIAPGPEPQVMSASLQIGEEKAHQLEEQRKVVTVLFADLAEPLSQLEAEAAQRVLGVYFSAVAAQVQRFGGTIDKFIGDAVMAVFGAPVSHEDDAARAVHAAVGIQAAIRKENDRLERQHGVRLSVRVGVNTGEVVAGLLPGEILAYTVTGDVVNTAQRIESATAPNEVWVSEATAALARKTFLFEPVPPLTLKGKARPVPAYRVLGAQLEAATIRSAELLGRETELARLESLFAEASSGRGQLVHIHGEAGLGKSRLVEELRGRLPADAWQMAARCSSYESRQGYGLIADVIRRAFGVQIAAEEEEARRVLAAGLAPLGLSFAEGGAAMLLLEVLGYESRSSLDPEGKRRQLVAILRTFLEYRSALGPFAIVIEDLHWSDEASASVLGEVLAGANRLRCLVITTSRDVKAGPWLPVEIALTPLDVVSSTELLDRVASEPVTAEIREQIIQRTGGNPFFIEEVVRALGSGRATTVPATIQELLEARVDALDATPKHVAQRAAVIGRTFWLRVLGEVSAGEPVGHAIAFLETEGFVAPYEMTPEEKYAFRHALVQEVFYQTQLVAQRRRLHGDIGSAIERLFSERVDEFTDILAFHFDHSADDERAVTWLERAGERARRLFANAEAIAHFGRAAERARADPRLADRLPSVLLSLADVRVLIGELDEALRLYTEVRDRTNDARAWRGLARIHRDRGEYAESLRIVDAALAAVAPGTDTLPLTLERAQTLSVQGQFTEAIAAAGAALAKAADRRDPVVAQLLVRLARSEAVAGQGEAALAHAREARAISAECGDVVGELVAIRLIGDSCTRLGRLDEGVAAFQEALRLAEKVGAVAEAAGGLLNLGWAERRRGRIDEAIAHDRRAAEQFDRIRHGSGRATAYGNLASHLVLRGDFDEALAQAEVALGIARAIDHTYTIADVFQTIASARLGREEFPEAAGRAEESAELFLRMGARPQATDALRLAADAWTKAGDAARARDLESRARAISSS